MLNERQETFVREYLTDFNATRSAIAAGYSPSTAYSSGQRLLKHVEIREKLGELTGKRFERLEIDADYVLEGIKDTIERCSQGTPVFDEKGRETGEWEFEPMAVLKGFELLGKHLKLFTEKIEHSGQVDHHDLSALSESQLDEIERIVESADTHAGRDQG
jgi:phage terminase small subunit